MSATVRDALLMRECSVRLWRCDVLVPGSRRISKHQQPCLETPQTDWGDFDPSKPISSRIIFEDESDFGDESGTSDSELSAAGCSMVLRSNKLFDVSEPGAEEYVEDETGSRQVKGLNTFVKEEPPTWEADDISIECEIGVEGALIKQELEIGPTLIQPRTISKSQLPTAEATTSAQQKTSSVIARSPLLYDLLIRPSSIPRIQQPMSSKYSFGLHSSSHGLRDKPLSRWQEPKKCDRRVEDIISRSNALQGNTCDKTSEKQLKCGHCDYTASERYQLHVHNRSHAGERLYKYRCVQCGFNESHHGNFQRHMRTHTGERPYKCEHCDYSASERPHMRRHMRTHTGERPYKCAHCDYSATRSCDLQKHQFLHTGEKPYKCAHCDYSSSGKVRLKEHQYVHTGEKPFKCAHCDYSTSKKVCLKEHQYVHTGEKPYKCAHCDYSSSQKVRLKEHQYVHTVEKPYKCAHCDYSSCQKVRLKEHQYVHTGEKQYKCAHCDYSSSQKVRWKEHQYVHTGEKPYKCAHCDYSSSKKVRLKEHQYVHTGEKPYKCAHCDYSSFQKVRLKEHQYVHTVEKQYKCAHCDYSSCHKVRLKNHVNKCIREELRANRTTKKQNRKRKNS